VSRSANWKRSLIVDLLVRYLGFPFWDILWFPSRRCRTSASVFHFAAFFDRAFRKNAYLWERLDGAERLVGILLEDRNQSGAAGDVTVAAPPRRA